MPSKISRKAVRKVGKVQKNMSKTDTKKKKERKKIYAYIFKILKQVHPHTRIPGEAMSIMNGFVNDVSQRISTKAFRSGYYNKISTIRSCIMEEETKDGYTEDSFSLQLYKELLTLEELELNKELNMKEEMQEETYKKIQTVLDSKSFLLLKKCKEIMNFKINNDNNKVTSTRTPSESSSLSWDYYGLENMKQSKIMNLTKRSNDSHSIASTSFTPIVSDDEGETTDEKVIDYMDSADFISKSISKDKLLQGQVLAEYEAHRKVTECNYPLKTGVKSLPDSFISEVMMELYEISTESSPTSSADSSFINSSEQGIAPPPTPTFQSSVADLETKEFTDSTINIHDIGNNSSTFISDNRPKTDDEEIMDSMNSVELTSTQMSKKVEDLENKESTDSTINIHDIGNNSSTFISDSRPKTDDEEIMDTMNSAELISTRQKVTPSKPMFMKAYDKAGKDKKPEDIRDMKVKIHRRKRSSKCSTCLKCFIILLISTLPLLLFQFYFRFDAADEYFEGVDENDEYADVFATAIVEVEEGILDHDATVQALTRYLERDTPPLKVVALVGDTSVDKPYTVDIIKKKLRKRRRYDPPSSFPTFIVLENLRAEHSKFVINYINAYQEAYGNREFTILAVYKVEQIDDDLTRVDLNHTINSVKDFFIKANIIMKIIPYKPVSEDTIEIYIRSTAKNIGQTFSQDQIDYYKRRLIEDDTDCQREYDC